MRKLIHHLIEALSRLLAPPGGRHRAAMNHRLQRRRRRELWLATYGIDAGPRAIQIHARAVSR